VVYHPNPLDAGGVGRTVERYGATIILGSSSFFALYARGCQPEQFRTLRLAVAGAQKLVPSVAETFEKRFGLPISEGYGCTELSPVVSVNVPDVHFDGETQTGTRRGSVGRPLPGLAVRIVPEESIESAGTISPTRSDVERGIVIVKGPGVMIGYLEDREATARVLRGGWYVTGDIGGVDEDGFLYIHDRLARFSKIAGEMVPHGAVEDALHRAAGSEEWHFAVVSVPDRVRGERLAVLYSGPRLDPDALIGKMAASDIPNMWLPSRKDFYRVDSLPLLPGGKTDLAGVRKLVKELQKDSL